MSYDLIVFDPAVAPRDRTLFLSWYKQQQSEWQESHDDNPEIPGQPLRQWFREMIKTFPPMNGPLASDDPDNPKTAEYSLGRSAIYISFAWSEANAAYEQVKELATQQGVGFFDASGEEGDIWWPVPGWKLSCESRGDIPLPLDLTFGDLLHNLDSQKNSFYVLEHDEANYMQCGGSPRACTVELRVYSSAERYKHSVVGRANDSTAPASITMSSGAANVQTREVLNAAEAAELFALFLRGEDFPKKYSLREIDL